jgi:hypothetical protein
MTRYTDSKLLQPQKSFDVFACRYATQWLAQVESVLGKTTRRTSRVLHLVCLTEVFEPLASHFRRLSTPPQLLPS